MQQNFDIFVHLDAVKSVQSNDWIFEGIASTSDVDLYGEVVYPDSFKNSIEFFKNNGKIFFNHSYAQKNADWLKNHGFSQEQILALKMPVGKPLDAKLTDDGLYIKAVLNKEHPLSSFIWNSFMNNSDKRFHDTMGLSIGAKYLGESRREYNIQKGKYVTYLPELLLYEVSVTPEPVNPNTKTWAYAMKSMAATSSVPKNVRYHTIVPDEVVYDPERDRLVVKSTVTGSSGATHVFETYINIEEDIEFPMEKNKQKRVARKALPEEEDALLGAEDTLANDDAQLADDLADSELDEAAVGQDDDAVDDPALGGDAGLGDDEDADAAVDDLLGSLVGDDSGEEPQEDEAQAMILDKLDSILDALQTLAEGELGGAPDLAEGNPAEGQVDDTPPLLKSTEVELSEASTKKFGAALKSILEGWEDRVVEKLIQKLSNETTVVKSVMQPAKSTKPIHPGVSLDASTEANDEIVQKSVVEYPGKELSSANMDVLKSLVEDYIGIRGYTTESSQRRGRIVRQAEEQLGVSQAKFHQYVREHEQAARK